MYIYLYHGSNRSSPFSLFINHCWNPGPEEFYYTILSTEIPLAYPSSGYRCSRGNEIPFRREQKERVEGRLPIFLSRFLLPCSCRLRRERKERERERGDKERQAAFVKDRRNGARNGGGKNAAVLNLHRLLYARDATKDLVFEFRIVQRGITFFAPDGNAG